MKKDARSLKPEAQSALRQRAVTAVMDGMTQTKAAEVFGVTRQAVSNWVKAYRTGGAQGLEARKRGPKGEQTTLRATGTPNGITPRPSGSTPGIRWHYSTWPTSMTNWGLTSMPSDC